MINIPGRKTTSLNGKWQAIIDLQDVGICEWKAIWKDRKPTGKSDFYEYSFDNGTVLDVPGNFNSQMNDPGASCRGIEYKMQQTHKNTNSHPAASCEEFFRLKN